MLDGLKKIVSPFVGFEEKPESTPTDGTASGEVQTSKPQSNHEAAASEQKTVPEKFRNYFIDLMKSMDLPGPDYFEYAQMKKDLETDLPKEDARIRLAAKTLKISKPKLMESASTYLAGCQKDKENFLATVSKKESETIGAKNQTINLLEKQNKEIDDLIRQKEKEKSDNLEQIEKHKEDISIAEEKIKANQEGYLLAYDEIVGTLTEDIKKIKTIL